MPGSSRRSNGERNAASRPGRTTVIPPGLRRSLATFALPTPSEHEREVAPRTAVCTASATTRACANVGQTSPRSRYPSSSPVRSTVGTTPRTVSHTARE